MDKLYARVFKAKFINLKFYKNGNSFNNELIWVSICIQIIFEPEL